MSADNPTRAYQPAGAGADDPYATRPLNANAIVAGPSDIAGEAPHSPGAVARRRTRDRRRRGKTVLSVLLFLLASIVLAVGASLYYLDRNFAGKIYPNVTVQGLPVGMLTPQEAEAALRARYGTFIRQPVTLTFGDRTWQPTPAELGITFDFAVAAEGAYRAGRGNGMLANVQQVAAIWQNGLDLPLRVTFDQNQMQSYLGSVAASLEQPPVDALLVRDGLAVATSPAQVGRQLLVNETVQSLTEALQTLTPQEVPIRTRDIQPRLLDDEVAAAKQQIETILQGPITLSVAGKQYSWSAEEIGRMLTVARVAQDASSDRLEVSLDQKLIDWRIQAIADETDRVGTNPRLEWSDGELKIIKEGSNGLRVDEQQARQVVLDAITGDRRAVALPVQELAPPVNASNLDALGITEMVSVGRSDFTGSAAYRIHNIGAGMDLLHGILIAPGDEFSFNNTIGDIDEKNGFVKGYAIIENRTQLEFGGGICQDSTTVFRAAFWAGLPFTEWRGHQFYISWYDRYALGEYGNGAGMDATIFTGPGGQDLRFVNDTGNWLLLQAFSNPKSGLAEVRLYGTKPDRKVELTRQVFDRKPARSEPEFYADPAQPQGSIKRTDTARAGMTVEITRIVTEGGVRKKPDVFRTKYEPWSDKYAVNPADLGPDGKPLIGLPDGSMPWIPQPPPPAVDPAQQPAPAVDPAQPAPAVDPAQQPAPAQEQEQPTPAPTTDGEEQSDG